MFVYRAHQCGTHVCSHNIVTQITWLRLRHARAVWQCLGSEWLHFCQISLCPCCPGWDFSIFSWAWNLTPAAAVQSRNFNFKVLMFFIRQNFLSLWNVLMKVSSYPWTFTKWVLFLKTKKQNKTVNECSTRAMLKFLSYGWKQQKGCHSSCKQTFCNRTSFVWFVIHKQI